MNAPEPQTAGGKVPLHFSMSLDGFVAGPNHAMDWLTGVTGRDGVEEEYIKTTGAVLGGRNGWDRDPSARPYNEDWNGPIFVPTSGCSRLPRQGRTRPGTSTDSCRSTPPSPAPTNMPWRPEKGSAVPHSDAPEAG